MAVATHGVRDVTDQPPTGDDRCWPCAVANSAVGFIVGWLPVAAALSRGRTELIALSLVWGVAVTGYTGYRLVALGHLPYAETVAKRTGLHGLIGPGAGRHGGPRDDE